METVWRVFAAIALVLAVAGWLALRIRGGRAPSFVIVGKCLIGMALGTAVFPLLLPHLGARWWIAGYVAFVAVLTAVMTTMAVTRATRRTDSGEVHGA